VRITHVRQLGVWRFAVQLAQDGYKRTERFPDQHKHVLTSQIQRSAISIPSGIARGNGRASRKDDARFVSDASGSCAELQSQLLLAGTLGFVTDDNPPSVLQSHERIGQMLQRLHQSLRRAPSACPECRVPSPGKHHA